jgi:hypothetical protein
MSMASRNHRHSIRLAVGILLVPTLLSPALAQESSRAQTKGGAQELAWRRIENDGVNCLYLELQWCGYEQPFEQYLTEVGNGAQLRDLGAMAAAARRLGYELEPMHLSMAELESTKVPVIAHLERTDQHTGYFAVVVEFNQRFVLLVNGPQASVRQVTKDTFRREWSGYALLPGSRSPYLPTGRRAVAALMVGFVLVSVGKRFLSKGKQCQANGYDVDRQRIL